MPCATLLGAPRDTVRKSCSNISSLDQLSLLISAWLVMGGMYVAKSGVRELLWTGMAFAPSQVLEGIWHYIKPPTWLCLTPDVCPHHCLWTACSEAVVGSLAPCGQTFIKPLQRTSGEKEARTATIWMWRQTHKPRSIFYQWVHWQCQNVLKMNGQMFQRCHAIGLKLQGQKYLSVKKTDICRYTLEICLLVHVMGFFHLFAT